MWLACAVFSFSYVESIIIGTWQGSNLMLHLVKNKKLTNLMLHLFKNKNYFQLVGALDRDNCFSFISWPVSWAYPLILFRMTAEYGQMRSIIRILISWKYHSLHIYNNRRVLAENPMSRRIETYICLRMTQQMLITLLDR